MEYWKATQAALQPTENPLVKKPKLTDQLLQRPPFRFLHDVISAVQAKTGFAPGLYSEQEANAKAITDKDAKIEYLRKIIQVVEIATGTSVVARPLKIVAGLEPENTNNFLQLLAIASQKGDARDAVVEVLGVDKHPGAVPTSVAVGETGRPASRPSSQRLSHQASTASDYPAPASGDPPPRKTETIIHEPHASKISLSSRGDSQTSKAAPFIHDDSDASKTATSCLGVEVGPNEHERKIAAKARISKQDPSGEEASGTVVQEAEAHAPAEQPSQKVEGGGGAAGGPPESSKPPLQRRPIRPQSAKRAPPKIKTGDALVRRPPSGGRPGSSSSSGSVQNNVRPKVFLEGDNQDEELVDVVEDDCELGDRQIRCRGEDGALVKDILQVDQQLVVGEDGLDKENDEVPEQGIVLQRRVKKPDAVSKAGDLSHMQEMVQQFCKNVVPLGRCLEFLQEDIDAMGKEAKFWENERSVYQSKMDRALETSDEELQALESQIKLVENQIAQAKGRIVASKGQVLVNHQSIMNILMNVSSKGNN